MEQQWIQDFRPVLEELQHAEAVTIISHEKPDADAYGATLGLGGILRENCSCSVELVNASALIQRHAWFPHVDDVRMTPSEPSGRHVLVFVDCALEERVGGEMLASLHLDSYHAIINIDHHISNSLLGKYRIVAPKLSSTCELLTEWAFSHNLVIPSEAATCLLAGIYGDTGSFCYEKTTAETFKKAAMLLECGAERDVLVDALFSSVSLPIFCFKSAVLQKAEFHAGGKIAWAVATEGDFRQFGVGEEASEGIVEQLRNIQDVDVAFIIREVKDLLRVSLRSRSSEKDVSTVAANFGGGGHACAAAFRVARDATTVPELVQRILQSLKGVV